MTYLIYVFLFVTLASVQAQFFDPVIDDKTYLDQIDFQLVSEVEASALHLINQAKVTEKVTKSYITIKLKDNVFKALRTLALAEGLELDVNSKIPSRTGRQDGSSSGDADSTDSEQTEGGDDDSATEKATTPLTGLSTAVKINQNVFNFIGEAIKTIFKGVGGGKKNVLKESATRNDSELTSALPNLMQKPYGEQLLGILNLFSKENNGGKKIASGIFDRNPFDFLFGKRARQQSIPREMAVAEYIDKVQQSHPSKFPDLYQGISEPQRLLEAMAKVIAGIQQDVNQS